MENKIHSHKDLKAWQESMDLVIDLYKMMNQFPEHEKYVLNSQIKRAAISIPSNIAEGFARQGSKELIQFLYIALGSLSELETQLEIAFRLHYVSTIESLMSRIKFIRVLLSNLIKSIKSKTSSP